MNKSFRLDEEHSVTVTTEGQQMHVTVLGPDEGKRQVACRAIMGILDVTRYAITLEHREFAPPLPPGSVVLTPSKGLQITASDSFRLGMNKEPAPPPEKQGWANDDGVPGFPKE